MKSKLGIMFLLALMMAMFCVPVSAASTSESIVAAGFYDIGTATNVTIAPKASSGQVRTLETNLDDDDELEILCRLPGLEVTKTSIKIDSSDIEHIYLPHGRYCTLYKPKFFELIQKLRKIKKSMN